MSSTKYRFFIIALFVGSGSINTLCVKWADLIKTKGVNNEIHLFNHPFFQTSCMFLGESSCLIVFKILHQVYKSRGDEKELTKGNRAFNPFILIPPAMCDMLATSLMYISLNLTYASSFQMLRGAVIIFVAVLSMIVFRRFLNLREWLGVVLIIVGLILVGLADFFSKETNTHGKRDILIGDMLIVLAQILIATQMVIEEKFLKSLDLPPLQAVGWEGIFGFIVIGILQICFYFIKVGRPFAENPRGRLEDTIDAFLQIGSSWQLGVALSLTVFIACFNFAGVSVTKEISATSRKVLDNGRTVIVWPFSLFLFGQKFHWLQLLGFIILIIGIFIYNDVLTYNNFKWLFCMKMRCRKESEVQTEEVT